MKFTIVLVTVLAAASAQIPGFEAFRGVPYTTARPIYRPSTVAPVSVIRPSSSDGAASIVRYDNDVNPDGSYSYALETDNGIAIQEQGVPKEFSGTPVVKPVVAQGSFGYTSPEGQFIYITYNADENGFQPAGDSIPTAPPTPEYILRALEYIARNPPAIQKKK